MWPLFEFRRTWLFFLSSHNSAPRIGESRWDKKKKRNTNAIVLPPPPPPSDSRIEIICVRIVCATTTSVFARKISIQRRWGNGQYMRTNARRCWAVLECFFFLRVRVCVCRTDYTLHINNRKSFPDIFTFTSAAHLCLLVLVHVWMSSMCVCASVHVYALVRSFPMDTINTSFAECLQFSAEILL